MPSNSENTKKTDSGIGGFLNRGFLSKSTPLRSNKFRVDFGINNMQNLPFNEYKIDNTFLSYSVSSVTVPNFSVDVGQLEINDWKYFYYKNRTDADLRIEFNEGTDMKIRQFFTGWINYGFNLETRERKYIQQIAGVGASNSAGDKTGHTITIVPLNAAGVDAFTADTFIGIFPMDVGSLNYNYNSENEVLKTEVTFKYHMHKVI